MQTTVHKRPQPRVTQNTESNRICFQPNRPAVVCSLLPCHKAEYISDSASFPKLPYSNYTRHNHSVNLGPLNTVIQLMHKTLSLNERAYEVQAWSQYIDDV